MDDTHRAPAAGAGLGDERLIGAVHGGDLEGGSRPEAAAAADDGALMHAELVQHHARAEAHAAGEALRKDVPAVVPACLRPGT